MLILSFPLCSFLGEYVYATSTTSLLLIGWSTLKAERVYVLLRRLSLHTRLLTHGDRCSHKYCSREIPRPIRGSIFVAGH